MNLFQIPKILEGIKSMDDPEARIESIRHLAEKLDVEIEREKARAFNNIDEGELIGLIQKKYKEFISKILALLGFIMISISGVLAIWRSF